MSVNATTGQLVVSTSSAQQTYSGYFNGYTTFSTYDSHQGKQSIGADTEHFYRKIRNHELLPITSWYQFEINASYAGSRQYYGWAGGCQKTTYVQTVPNVNNWTGNGWSHDTWYTHTSARLLDYVDDSMLDDVVTSALTKLMASNHDTLTFVAEFGKVVNMFRSLGKRLALILQRHTMKDIAALWLEGRYGWRTLLYDMEAIEEAIERLGKKSPIWRAISGYPVSFNVTEAGSNSGIGNWFTFENQVHGEVTVNYRGIAVGDTKPPSFGGNVLTTAWELVPFSFVIDWFFNIGAKINYIANTCTYFGTAVSGYGLRIDARTTSITGATTNSGCTVGSFSDMVNSASATITTSLVKRHAHNPSFLPSFRLKLDGYKVLDLMAILYRLIH
jgi:hypothetical protein